MWSKETNKKIDCIREMLVTNGLYTDSDEYSLEMLGNEFETLDMCLEDIKENGVTMKDRTGVLKINPAATLKTRTVNTISQIMKDMCISTKARKLILMKDVDTGDDDSPLTAYMKSIV